MTVQEAQERVARGAALLDDKKPGWAGRINTDTLELEDPCGCVVGQLCGVTGLSTFYPFATRELGINRCLAVEMGFDIYRSDCTEAAWRLLQDAWIVAIADRLVPAATWTHRQPELVGQS